LGGLPDLTPCPSLNRTTSFKVTVARAKPTAVASYGTCRRMNIDVESRGKQADGLVWPEPAVSRPSPANRALDATKAALLTFITLLLVAVPTSFRGGSWKASLTHFPVSFPLPTASIASNEAITWELCANLFDQVCTPGTIHLPNFFPSALRPLVSCPSLVLGLALLVAAYWFCALDIIVQERWKARYTRWIILAAIATIAVELFRSGDMASIFAQVVPIQVNLCVLLCLAWDLVKRD